MPFRVAVKAFVVVLALVPVLFGEEGPYRFPEAKFETARVRYVEGVPLFEVGGSPEEIGRRTAKLVGEAGMQLVDFPKKTLESRGRGEQWPLFRTAVQVFQPNIPKPYFAEIEAYSKATGLSVDRIVAANVMPDVYRAFGCSSLIVEAERSATGGPLFARNLDFFTLGTLHRYDLVTVVRPTGKHAFVSVGFPGLVGVLSGMNDAGLSLAVHEVDASKDESVMVNWLGVPYTMAFRRILEECETVEEARKLLESLPRTTKLNLAICDRTTSAVLEITPKSVERRSAIEGLTACTNHFRTDALCTTKECRRYERLDALRSTTAKLDVAALERQLDAVNQGNTTLQSMIFEPRSLRLHVSLEGQPSSKGPFRTLDLAELLAPVEPTSASGGR